MCGRYYIDEETAKEIQKITDKVQEQAKIQRYGIDICPTDMAPVLIGESGHLVLAWQRWGYPGREKNSLIFNARAESAAEKPLFQDGIRSRRAVIAAAHFYEWNRQREKVTFFRNDGKLLYMAGLYRRYDDGDHYVILTTAANGSMITTHDRMPLILEPEEIRTWILEPEAAEGMLRQEPVMLSKKSDYEQLTFKF